MKQTIHLLSRLVIIMIILMPIKNLVGQSSCNPILTYDNSYNLCEDEGLLSLTVSVGLPPGCAYVNTVTPFEFFGPGNSSLGEIDENYHSIANPQAGDYYVEINLENALNGTCPCTGSQQSNMITVSNAVTVPQISNDSNTEIYCGESTILEAVGTNANGGGTFNWYDANDNLVYTGATFETNTLSEDVQFSITHIVNGCESDPFAVDVIVNELPVPTVLVDSYSIYCDNSITLEASSSFMLHWHADAALTDLLLIGNEMNTPDLEIGNYTYYVATVNGTCKSAATAITVDVTQPDAPTTNDESACLGMDIVLTAAGTNTGVSEIFQWLDEQNNIVFTGAQYQLPSTVTGIAGEYNYKVYSIVDGCRSGSFSSQTVDVFNLPQLQPVTPEEVMVCEGESISFLAEVTDGIASYEWTSPSQESMDSSNGEIEITNSTESSHEGLWSVEATDANGCISAKAYATAIINPRPIIGLVPSYEITDGETAELFATGGIGYEWSPSEYLDNSTIANPTVTNYPEITTDNPVVIDFDVAVFDGFCSDTASTKLTIMPWEERPVVYDVITPNQDGYNDIWKIDYLYNLDDYTIYVFDEQSQIVFYHDYLTNGEYTDNNAWDGTQSNKENAVSTGVYRYIIESGNQDPIIGMLTILSE